MRQHDGFGGVLTTDLILQIPDTVFVCELLVAGAALGQDAALKATHVEEQIGVVLAVHRHKAVLHCTVVTERGRRFLMSQNTARPLRGLEETERKYYKTRN